MLQIWLTLNLYNSLKVVAYTFTLNLKNCNINLVIHFFYFLFLHLSEKGNIKDCIISRNGHSLVGNYRLDVLP